MDDIFDEDGKDAVVDGQIGFDELIVPQPEIDDEQPKYVPPIEGQVSIDALPSLSTQLQQQALEEKPKEKIVIPKVKPKQPTKPKEEKIKAEKEEPKAENPQQLDKEAQEWLEQVKDKDSIAILEKQDEAPLYKDVHGIKTKKEKDMKEEKTQTPYNSNGGTSDGLLYKAIDDVLHESMIPYSEHVIMDRALPRVEDGLKPVQRRILYSMIELGVTPDKPYRKSARIVGDCMGKYHPHGDSSVYDAMVRLAQPFNTNGILIDGHGNFGSVDGDSAAAMRYTEARLAPLALELLRDLEKNTVHWSFNFDDTLQEPDILPGRFPNLLVNGCQGIAVGLATNIPPHNLGEVIDGVVAYIDNNKITLKEMLKIIKGPDFPTGGYIINGNDLEQIYETGKGRIIMRAKLHIENNGATQSIVITEFPYQTNKVTLMQKIASLREDNKELLNISEIRDESDRNGDRVVLRLKKDTNVKHVINALFKSTGLQNTFGANMVAIADGKPKQMPLLDIISYYVAYQRDIIYKRTKYDLDQAKEREHILSGLLIAIKNINEVIKIIKSSKTTTEAKDKLKVRFSLSDRQAQAIMEMRLSRLTNLEVEKLEAEIKELQALIKKLTAILGSKKLQFDVIKTEILAIKKQFKKERQTQIIKNADTLNIPSDTDKPAVQETYIVSNELGNIKSVGKKYYSLAQKEFNDNSTLGEVHSKILFTSTDKTVLIFTNKANCFKVKASSIPEARFKDKGLPAHKVIPNFTSEEKIVGIFAEDTMEKNLILTTKNGMVKKTKIEEYHLAKSSFQTMKLKEGDEIINVFYEEQGTLVYVTNQGMVLNSKMDDIALQGRISQGVMGIALNKGDYVIYCELATSKDNIAILTDVGNTKKVPVSSIEESVRNRKGVKLIPAEAGKKIVIATINANATLVAPVDEGFVYKEVDKIGTESRTTKGKGITKKKVKLAKGYVYNL